jgi:hypothetical protein
VQEIFTILAINPIEPRRKSQKLLALINDIEIKDSCRSDE